MSAAYGVFVLSGIVAGLACVAVVLAWSLVAKLIERLLEGR
jgi:hypothetical protein